MHAKRKGICSLNIDPGYLFWKQKTFIGIFYKVSCKPGAGGGAVGWEALLYKPEGSGFDSRWCYFLLTLSFRPHYGHGVESASNRKDYKEYFLGVQVASG